MKEQNMQAFNARFGHLSAAAQRAERSQAGLISGIQGHTLASYLEGIDEAIQAHNVACANPECGALGGLYEARARVIQAYSSLVGEGGWS